MKKNFSAFNFRLSNYRGFTLVELIVVIAILGILAAAILVAINPAQRIASSRNARVKSEIASLGKAASAFNLDTASTASCLGSYPHAFNLTICTKVFPVAPPSPGAAYVIAVYPTGCTASAATTSPCTSIAISGPVFDDGTFAAQAVVFATGDLWCWKSTTGTISRVLAGACTAP